MLKPILDPRQYFLGRFKEDRLVGFAAAIDDAYARARTFCLDEMRIDQARDVYPHVRRGFIEDNLQSLASRHEMTSRSVPNAAGNCRYVELEYMGIVVTCSAVDSPGAFPRDAVFREQLARSSQIEMFEDEEPIPDDTRLYTLLLHGGEPLDEHPGFLNIGFPDRACREFLVSGIDLVKNFPSIRDLISPVEEVARPQHLGLRKPARETQRSS